MASYKVIYFFIFTLTQSVMSMALFNCASSDSECVLKAANVLLPLMMAGDPSKGVESSDPMHQEHIHADIAGLKYNFSDVTVKGFSSCYVEKIKASIADLKILADVVCKWDLTGHYAASGRLIILPIEGDGKFSIQAQAVRLTMDIDLKKIKDDNGVSHLIVRQYTFETDPIKPATFYLENLFNGNKILGDQVLKFANDNYKEVLNEVGGPVYKANVKKAFKNINKYLKTIDAKDLIN